MRDKLSHIIVKLYMNVDSGGGGGGGGTKPF